MMELKFKLSAKKNDLSFYQSGFSVY